MEHWILDQQVQVTDLIDALSAMRETAQGVKGEQFASVAVGLFEGYQAANALGALAQFADGQPQRALLASIVELVGNISARLASTLGDQQASEALALAKRMAERHAAAAASLRAQAG